jgi:hypothetical protein
MRDQKFARAVNSRAVISWRVKAKDNLKFSQVCQVKRRASSSQASALIECSPIEWTVRCVLPVVGGVTGWTAGVGGWPVEAGEQVHESCDEHEQGEAVRHGSTSLGMGCPPGRVHGDMPVGVDQRVALRPSRKGGRALEVGCAAGVEEAAGLNADETPRHIEAHRGVV